MTALFCHFSSLGIRRRLAGAACLVGALLAVGGCGGKATDEQTGAEVRKQKLIVYHAASLALPFGAIEKVMEERFPGLDVICESSSSRIAIRKVTDLGRKGDIVASADEALIRNIMMPDHADWVGTFARNRVVIAYTDRSRYRDEINADNWYEILLRDDVNYGQADANNAPVGYRTWLTWKLADAYYADKLGDRDLFEELRANCPPKNIRPHCNELIPLLESLALDYTFQYRSVALQHHLSWLKLPDEIDLGSETQREFYAKVSVEIAGTARGSITTKVGKPVLYGVTMIKDPQNPEMALEFLKILFSEEGQKILEENFQEPIVPVYCDNVQAAPEVLRQHLRPADF
jgi:molybdate/tungstate transport system substrate-binding protein